MKNQEAVIEYLMEKVIELKDRVKFLEKHIDKQNEIIVKITERNNNEISTITTTPYKDTPYTGITTILSESKKNECPF